MHAINEKAKLIRLVIFDVDGVLSTGELTYGPNGNEYKSFHVHDGMGLRMLMQAGIEVAIITARNSPLVEKRMQDLEIKHVYQGNPDKIPAYEDLKNKLHLQDYEIAYVGDDLPDLPVLRRVGLSITVPNAPKIMQQHTHHVTKTKGGKGAAREVSELILRAQDKYDVLIDAFLQR
jgi:3-deoxy-D-manno-octulosonate 8-phosphate phosphatase (KDO 8-P phosphatase)